VLFRPDAHLRSRGLLPRGNGQHEPADEHHPHEHEQRALSGTPAGDLPSTAVLVLPAAAARAAIVAADLRLHVVYSLPIHPGPLPGRPGRHRVCVFCPDRTSCTSPDLPTSTAGRHMLRQATRGPLTRPMPPAPPPGDAAFRGCDTAGHPRGEVTRRTVRQPGVADVAYDLLRPA